MQALATNYIANGSLVVLLLQFAIPCSMAISFVLNGERYSCSQYLGACLILAGIVCALFPSFSDFSAGGGNRLVMWSGVMAGSCLPMSLSSVLKERILAGDIEADVIYINGWIALFQFVVAFPLLLLSRPATHIPVKLIPQHLLHGLHCFAGFNTITTGDHPDNCAMRTGRKEENLDRSRAPLYSSLYMVRNLGCNVLIIFMIKFGAANILCFVNASAHDHGFSPMRVTDIFALVLIMLGFVLYRFAKPLRHWLFPPAQQDQFDLEEERKSRQSKILSLVKTGESAGADAERSLLGTSRRASES
eukprot:g65998.t1